MIGRVLDFLRTYEPARLAGIKTALVGLLASVGLAVSPALDAKAGAVVAAATGALTLIQSVLTRGAVYSPATVDRLTAAAVSGQDAPGAPPIPEPTDPNTGYAEESLEVPEGY